MRHDNKFAMRTNITLLEIKKNSLILEGLPGLEIHPGQYLSAALPGDVLPSILFPICITDDQIEVADPFPSEWRAGQVLGLRGPLGKGFHLPTLARRVALGALDHSPARLLPLMELALAQGTEVCLYTTSLPSGLPEAVEVQPLDLLREAWGWADYLALDCPVENFNRIETFLPSPWPHRLPCPVEVLAHTQMPCAAQAECGLCEVKTSHGWKHACKDGPVFDLESLV